jgi:uncharacterized protein (DUF924 family)
MHPIEEVITFWFGSRDSASFGQQRPVWFQKNSEFDETIRSRFLPLYEEAVEGRLDGWIELSKQERSVALLKK